MLDALETRGARIVSRRTGEPVRLRGVNVSGMEYSNERLAGVTAAEADVIVREWGANVVRLPFVQSLVLDGGGRDYIRELEELVELFAERGAYSILDLQWLDREKVWGPGDNRVPPEPTEASVACWMTLSRVFRGVPHVVFDVFNEPHDVPVGRWVEWANRMVNMVRTVDADRVVMVGGLDWAYDLRGVELPQENVIYSTHVYPGKGTDWDGAFGDVAWTRPVFAGEWGGGDEDLEWGRRLVRYFEEREMGWTAWSWRDLPYLQKGGEATEFGKLVKESMRHV